MKKFVYLLFFSAVLFILFGQIASEWGTVKSISWRLTFFDVFFVLSASTTINFLNAVTWYFICKALGAKNNLKESVNVWILSNTARFLPGGFWQYPTRFVMAKDSGITKAVSGSSLILESVLIVGVGLFLVLILSSAFLRLSSEVFFGVLTILIATLLFFTNEKLMRILLGRVGKLLKQELSEETFSLNIRYLPLIVGLIVMQFVLAGFVLQVVAGALTNLELPLSKFIAVYALSWLLGYVAVFAPAGLGVQELSISTLLSPYLLLSLGTLVAIVFRFVLLLGEIITLGLSLVFRYRS